MSEQGSTINPEEAPPKLKMLMRAKDWSVRARVNRSGREEGEMIIFTGHVYAPTIDANTPLSKARAEIKLKSAQDRMSVKIGKEETVITLPLEDFAMERISAKIKELSGNFGLEMGIEFEANETTDRQLLEFVDFTFANSNSAAPPQKPAAAAPRPAGGPATVTR